MELCPAEFCVKRKVRKNCVAHGRGISGEYAYPDFWALPLPSPPSSLFGCICSCGISEWKLETDIEASDPWWFINPYLWAVGGHVDL